MIKLSSFHLRFSECHLRWRTTLKWTLCINCLNIFRFSYGIFKNRFIRLAKILPGKFCMCVFPFEVQRNSLNCIITIGTRKFITLFKS